MKFKAFNDFPKNTIYNMLKDAYSFDDRFIELFDNSFKECDNFFYSNPKIANEYGFIIVEDGILIAQISWNPLTKPYATIGHNCVISSYKKKGYGKILLEEALKRIKAQGFSKVKVTTNEALVSAQKNYESVGFKLIKRYKNEDTQITGDYLEYELKF